MGGGEETKKEKKNRLQQAWNIVRDFNREILSNETEINGRTFNYITADDVVNKLDKSLCAYCFLHDKHTPCGTHLKKWKDCKEKDMLNKEASGVRVTGEEMDEDDPCNQIFKNEFFPCFYELSSNPYFMIRTSLLFGVETPDLYRVWYKIQKNNMMYNMAQLDQQKRKLSQ